MQNGWMAWLADGGPIASEWKDNSTDRAQMKTNLFYY